jgi:hypothetical protein
MEPVIIPRAMTTDTPPGRRRPTLFWRLVIGLPLIALALLLIDSAARALSLPPEVAEALSVPPGLRVVEGALWGIAFGITGLGAIWGRRGALIRALWLLTGFMIYNAARLTLFARADYDRARLPFLVAAAIVAGLVVLGLTLWLRRRHMGG